MSNALVPTADVPPPATMMFRAKAAQRGYLLELLDRVAEGKPTSDRQMAIACSIDRKVIHRWQRDPGFQQWLNTELEHARWNGKSRVLARALALAERGSVDHMDFVAKVLGWYVAPGAPAGDRPVQINILVPRP